jgi:hypothetical protein
MKLTNRALAIVCVAGLSAGTGIFCLQRALANDKCWELGPAPCAALVGCDPECTLGGTRHCAGLSRWVFERPDECTEVKVGNLKCDDNPDPSLEQVHCYDQFNCEETSIVCPLHDNCYKCGHAQGEVTPIYVPPHKVQTLCPQGK